jgi:type IV pilus assembly protein PilA
VLHNTLKKLRARRDGEEGFTLIELMVVVLIIAILIAIAIPTFLGAKSRAQDKAAQSNVRNGITAAKTVFSDHQDYADADPAANTNLATVEPSLNFQAAGVASTQPKQVSVAVADTQGATVAGSDTIYMASLAKSGKCWAARDFQGPTTTAGITVGTAYAQVPSGTACSGTGAAGLPTTAWSDSF